MVSFVLAVKHLTQIDCRANTVAVLKWILTLVFHSVSWYVVKDKELDNGLVDILLMSNGEDEV